MPHFSLDNIDVVLYELTLKSVYLATIIPHQIRDVKNLANARLSETYDA